MRAVASVSGSGSGQAIGFFSYRGSRVAYAVTGSGPMLLLDVSRAHHLEIFWRHPRYRRLVQQLSRRFTVVRWDRPGFGLSDRHRTDLSTDGELAFVEELLAVLGVTSAAVLAAGDAGPGMIRFAARSPGRVSRLALFGTAVSGRPLVPSLSAAALDVLTAAAAPAIHEVVAASRTAGCRPDVTEWLTQVLVASADAAGMAALIASSRADDAAPDAPLVRAPTLVAQRAVDTVVEARHGTALASSIPGAELVQLDGGCHPLFAGDAHQVLAVLVPFLAGEETGWRPPLSRRELEIVEMVTLGLTNAEIGRRLAIRRRTVDSHLEHVRTKLGVSSRARIAAWSVCSGRLEP